MNRSEDNSSGRWSHTKCELHTPQPHRPRPCTNCAVHSRNLHLTYSPLAPPISAVRVLLSDPSILATYTIQPQRRHRQTSDTFFALGIQEEYEKVANNYLMFRKAFRSFTEELGQFHHLTTPDCVGSGQMCSQLIHLHS